MINNNSHNCMASSQESIIRTTNSLTDRLRRNQTLTDAEFQQILQTQEEESLEYLYQNARQVCDIHYGKNIYARGLIEFTNYCRNNCYYCGIRRENRKAERYRLTEEDIINCAKEGYALGFRTFVLQGGEDIYYTKEKLGHIITQIKKFYPECAVTLSFGEWDYDTYQYWHRCGADRYLLRHETADQIHYQGLHPHEMNYFHRMNCLEQLKETGYQVGAGFMVGSPGQTVETLVKDLRFLEKFQPHMIGIGPFIPQKDTPFAGKASGTLSMTRKLLSVLRLMFPKVLLPSTTALGTIHPQGREMGILSGANVVMPNLSPVNVRGKYLLYNDKIHTGCESAQARQQLAERIHLLGYKLCMDRGDSKMQTCISEKKKEDFHESCTEQQPCAADRTQYP